MRTPGKRGAQRTNNPLRQPIRFFDGVIADMLQNGEFITAQTRCDIVRSQQELQALGNAD